MESRLSCSRPSSTPPSTTTECASMPRAASTSARSDSVIWSTRPAHRLWPVRSSVSALASARSARSALRFTVAKSSPDCWKRRNSTEPLTVPVAGRRRDVGELPQARLQVEVGLQRKALELARPSRPGRATMRRRQTGGPTSRGRGPGRRAPRTCAACPGRRRGSRRAASRRNRRSSSRPPSARRRGPPPAPRCRR